MKKGFEEKEVARLEKLVENCAAMMKKRLVEKTHQGYRGWDDQFLTPTITMHLKADVVAMEKHFRDMVEKSGGLLPLAPNPSDVNRIVDVMNRSAFLLHALLEGNFERGGE